MKVVLLANSYKNSLKPIEDPYLLKFNGQALIYHWLRNLARVGLTEVSILANSSNSLNLQAACTSLDNNLEFFETENTSTEIFSDLNFLSEKLQRESCLIIKADQFIDYKALDILAQHIATDNPFAIFAAKKLKETSLFKFSQNFLSLDKSSHLKNLSSDLEATPDYTHQDLGMYYFKQLSLDSSKNFEIYVKKLIQVGHRIKVLSLNGFHQDLSEAKDILPLAKYFHSQVKIQGISPKAKIHGSAVISGEVVIAPGAKVDANAVIKGPAYIGENTIVGVNSFVRDSYINQDSVVGFGSEIVGSYLGSNVYTHANCLNHSVLGNNISFGAGSMVTSSREHLGLSAGNNIQVGVNTNFIPGVSLGSNSQLAPGLLIDQHIPSGSVVRSKTSLDIKPK